MLASYIRKWLEINGIPKKVKDIVGYCIRKENGKVFDDWDEGVITTMVAYHLAKDTISVIYEDDEVVGVQRNSDIENKKLISIRQRNGGPERVEYPQKFLKKLSRI